MEGKNDKLLRNYAVILILFLQIGRTMQIAVRRLQSTRIGRSSINMLLNPRAWRREPHTSSCSLIPTGTAVPCGVSPPTSKIRPPFEKSFDGEQPLVRTDGKTASHRCR